MPRGPGSALRAVRDDILKATPRLSSRPSGGAIAPTRRAGTQEQRTQRCFLGEIAKRQKKTPLR